MDFPGSYYRHRHTVTIAHHLKSIAAIALSGLLLLGGCGSGEPDFGGERPDGVVEHPVADSIPYYDRDHIAIDTARTVDEMDAAPEAVAALAGYLEDPEGANTHELDVLVNGAEYFEAVSVGEGRLVLLDSKEDRLLEYDLEVGEATVLAERGEGPGKLRYATDMTREGAVGYVAGSQRLSRFDCRPAPCEHERTVMTDLSPESIASAGGTLAALESGEGEGAAQDGGAVHLICPLSPP